jgi:DNA-directed RNA polymerase specialized sigma24 family protein
MQDAHFRALSHLNQFEGRSSFLTWLSRVMINEAYGHLRRRRVRLWIPFPNLTERLYGSRTGGKEHGGHGRESWRHRTMCEVSDVARPKAPAEADLSHGSRLREAHDRRAFNPPDRRRC